MSRSLIIAGLIVGFLVFPLTLQGEPPEAGVLAEEWVKNNPPGKTTTSEKPQVKDNKCPKIPPEEREELGLPAPTWGAQHGKVQPAAQKALEQQRKLIESKDPMMGFQFDRPCGFQGTAYVDIYLRHKVKGKPESKENQAAVKKAQDRLLRKLTAGEFSLFFAFKNTAGLVGYVNDAGLTKLIKDEDVIAVGLDDQPRAEYPPKAMHNPGEPRERTGKIELGVYKALEKSGDGYVFVLLSPMPIDWREVGIEKGNALVKEKQDRILSSLATGEFRLTSRGSSGGFSGYVNAPGLAKLNKHPDVSIVGLDETIRTPSAKRR